MWEDRWEEWAESWTSVYHAAAERMLRGVVGTQVTDCQHSTMSTIKFELRNPTPQVLLLHVTPQRSFAKKISRLPHYSSTRRRTHTECCYPWRILWPKMANSLPSHFPTVFSSLTHCPRIASASAPFQCAAWRLQAVRTARCTMGTGACRVKAEMLVLVLAV
jgi:hypothetical protein